MLLCQKSYLCKKKSMLYDSNGFKLYIYIFCFSKLVYVPHIYIFYWPYAKIPLSRIGAGHFWVSGFHLYIRGLSTSSNPNLAKPLSLSLSLMAAKALPRRFGTSSTESLQFLEDLTPFSSGSSNPKWFSLS
jgi:hypothetical protein